MAESSKGKQPSRSHRPSRLGDGLQVPNSDTVVPDTQLQAIDSDYRPEHQHEDLDADTLAVLERTTAKRQGDASPASQPVLPQTFGISKPTPVNLVEPGFCYMSMKRAAKKTSLEDNASDLQPPHHPDTAGSSIEHHSSGAHKQGTNVHTIETLRLTLSVDANIIPAGSLSFPSSTIKEHIITKKPQKDGAPFIREESQVLSNTCVAPITECTESGLPGTNSIMQAMPQPKIPTATITKKSRNGTRGKKGKKIVLSRSLVPWSPRHSPASGGFITPYTADSPTTRTPLDRNAESSGMPHEDGDLSVKPQNANVDKVHGSPSSSGDVQNVLHVASSRAGSSRVTKAQKKSRPTGNQSQGSIAVGNWQASSKTKALDAAFDNIRNACLAEQNQLENQMTSTIEELKEDKMQLQKKLLEQQTVIAEQRMRLETYERNHARLNEEAKKIQRYAAGLQNDYEKCRKSVLSFEKDTKQTLQDQIADLVREKADLEVHVNQVKDAFNKDKGKWKKIVEEAQTQHIVASSQNTDLKKQLVEQTRMYEAERSRCIEIEKQLLLSLRTLQHQSSESSATLIDKLSSIGTIIDSLASENCKDSGIKDCLRILQRLDSMPLLTANDVRRVEGMVRSLYEQADAGSELLVQSSASKRISIEDIQRFMRDQVQMLQAEILRHHQAVEDGHLAQKTIESLREELGTQKQIHQKLEDRVNEFRQSELSLTSNIAQVKKERDELQAAIHERDNQPWQSDLQVMQLQDTLNEVEQSLLLAIDRTERIERLRLEQERNYCEYRSSAQAHLTSLQEQMSTMTNQLQAGVRERRALQDDVVDLKRSLESVQAEYDRLVTEVSQCESTIETLRQERDRLEEKYGVSKSSLHSVGEKMQALEDARNELTASFMKASTSLRDSQCAEMALAKKNAGLQEELAQLQRADDTRTEQLQQLQLDAAIKLQQEKQKHSTEIEDLESRLCHSENARKESAVRVRQMEAAHGQQLECLEQKTQAKFNYLGLESQQEREKLKAKYSQELQQFQQRANGPNLAHGHCEDSNQQSGYFEEEYRNRFGTQAPLQEHKTSHSLVDLAAEIVPETQEFENTKGSAMQFDMIESQVSLASDFNHQQTPSELSTISSEDLSEMLLDNASPDALDPNNATSKPTCEQRASVRDGILAGDADSGQKRKAVCGPDQHGPSKKLRTSAQSSAQRPSSTSRDHAQYTPAPTVAISHPGVNTSPSRATGRRSSNRLSSIAGSQGSTPRLSSTRNTRSKTNRYADRFEQELDRR
ncbi:hypothetical protein EJ07DRAFT_178857 [Lizonia empirigonia]|nr:hypothetical protein EJ07DRAFT_178857 [Lizonia empirigonia]